MVRSLAILLCVALAAVAAPVPKPIPVEHLIRDLSDPDPKTRDAAEDALWRRGFGAIAPLKEVTKGTDKDTVGRAERLLKKLTWGLHADAPKEVADAVERYNSREERNLRVPVPPTEAAIELVETVALLGKPGTESLRAIAQTFAEEGGRGPDRWRLVQVGVRQAVAQLLFNGKEDDAAAVLEATLPERMQRDLRAYRLDRGLPVPDEKPTDTSLSKSVVERMEAKVKAFTPADRVRLLATQLKFTDALKVEPTKPKQDDPDGWRAWAAARAEVLLTIGHTDDADKLLGDELFDPLHCLPAVKVELASGRTDQAFKRVAKWLAEPENRDTKWTRWDKGHPRSLWGHQEDPDFAETLFPGRKREASSVWAVFRPNLSVEETLALTHRLMTGIATKAEYLDAKKRLGTEALAAVARAAGDETALENALGKTAKECYPTASEAPQPLGVTVVDNGHFLGRYFAHAVTLRPILEYGRYFADRGKHKQAAAEYLAGWEKFPNSPALLYLSGRELTTAGDAKEGARRMELAFRLPLADGDVWAEFLQQLLLADAPTEHLKRAAEKLSERPPPSMLVGVKAFQLVAQAYRKCGAFDAAAKCEERSAVCWSASGSEHALVVGDPRVVRSDIHPSSYDPPPLPHPADYLRLTGVPKLDRSLELLAAKKPAEAKKLAAEYFTLLPGDVAQVVRVVTAFDKAGATKEADELFAAVRDPLAAAVKEFPNAVALQRSLTELLVGCGREKK